MLIGVGAARADNATGHDGLAGEAHIRSDGATDYEKLRRELDSFKAAPVSLRKALAIAEGLRAGSRVVDISFDGTKDPSVYRVKTIQGDLIRTDMIDARSGSSLSTASESPTRELGLQDQTTLLGLRAVRQEISDAVVVAERLTSGTAISAGITMEAGRFNFTVVCVSGGDLKQVILEPPGVTSRGKRRHATR